MKWILALTLLLPITSHAEVRQTSTFAEIVEACTPDSLVVLDLDNCLIQAADPALRATSLYEHKEAWREMVKEYSDYADLLCFSQHTQPPILVDESIPNAIADLQAIGLTASLESYREIKTACLEGFGIDLGDIIFANGMKVDKGEVLIDYLADHRPAHILFADDRLKNVEAVDRACTLAGIPVTSFHYTAVLDQSPVTEAAFVSVWTAVINDFATR